LITKCALDYQNKNKSYSYRPIYNAP